MTLPKVRPAPAKRPADINLGSRAAQPVLLCVLFIGALLENTWSGVEAFSADATGNAHPKRLRLASSSHLSNAGGHAETLRRDATTDLPELPSVDSMN